MRRRYLGIAIPLAAVALLALPGVAFGQDVALDRIKDLKGGIAEAADAVNTEWVIVAACLVMFMQAGFLLLEVGFSRMKNVGAGVA